jgi:exonuclease SbcD
VLSRPELLNPEDLWDLPLQVIALPYVARSQMLAFGDVQSTDEVQISGELVNRLEVIVKEEFFPQLSGELPVLLAAHASVQGAIYGGERSVTLGGDLILPPAFVKDKHFDYVALGHIHKAQDVNEGKQPPVIYPGSIERVDFGEVGDEKFYVLVNLVKGGSTYEWRKLEHIRPFFDRRIQLEGQDGVMKKLLGELPAKSKMKDAIVRLTIDYPRELEPFIDEAELREAAAETFEFHLVKRPQVEARIRIPEDQRVGDLTPYDLLDIYWRSAHVDEADQQELGKLAKNIIELNPAED